MSTWPLVEGVIVAGLVGWSLRSAWRTLVPALRASLRPANADKPCGSACGGCEKSPTR